MLDTQARYARWQKVYRALKQRRLQMSAVWYARQLAKRPIADVQQLEHQSVQRPDILQE